MVKRAHFFTQPAKSKKKKEGDNTKPSDTSPKTDLVEQSIDQQRQQINNDLLNSISFNFDNF